MNGALQQESPPSSVTMLGGGDAPSQVVYLETGEHETGNSTQAKCTGQKPTHLDSANMAES